MRPLFLETWLDYDLDGTVFNNLADARKEFADDEAIDGITPLAIFQIDVDENKKVTVTEVPAEEPKEYWIDWDGYGQMYIAEPKKAKYEPNIIYVRNSDGGLDVVTGDERQSVIDRFFK